jgi:hypothetical protein
VRRGCLVRRTSEIFSNFGPSPATRGRVSASPHRGRGNDSLRSGSEVNSLFLRGKGDNRALALCCFIAVLLMRGGAEADCERCGGTGVYLDLRDATESSGRNSDLGGLRYCQLAGCFDHA